MNIAHWYRNNSRMIPESYLVCMHQSGLVHPSRIGPLGKDASSISFRGKCRFCVSRAGDTRVRLHKAEPDYPLTSATLATETYL
jgi:hypothetical protein